MTLVERGALALDPARAAWWWPQIVQIWTRIKSLHEAGAYDIDKQTAPKDIWLNDKELEAWFKERERIREERLRQPTLPEL